MSAQKGRQSSPVRISDMRRARKPAADHDDDIMGRQDRSERGRRTHHSVERHHHHESHSHHLPRQHSVEDLQRAVSQDTPKNLPNLKRWQSEEPMRHRPAGLKRSVSDLEDKEPTLSGAKTNLAQLGSFYGNGAWKQTHASRVQQLRGDGAKGLQATPADPSPVRASSFRPHHMAKQTTIFSASTSQLYDTSKIQQIQQVTPQSLEESELKKQTEWLNTIKKETAELEQRALRLDGQLQSWHEVKLNLKAEVACRIRETQEGLRGLETLLETTSVMLGKEKTLTETASTRQVKAYEELARVQEKAYWVHEHARDLEMRLGKQRDEVANILRKAMALDTRVRVRALASVRWAGEKVASSMQWMLEAAAGVVWRGAMSLWTRLGRGESSSSGVGGQRGARAHVPTKYVG